MSLLVESIKIFNGRMYNIAGHEERANRSRLELFGCVKPLNIRRLVTVPAEFSKGLVKCRVIYDEIIHDIQFQHYNIRNITSLVDIILNKYSGFSSNTKAEQLDIEAKQKIMETHNHIKMKIIDDFNKFCLD